MKSGTELIAERRWEKKFGKAEKDEFWCRSMLERSKKSLGLEIQTERGRLHEDCIIEYPITASSGTI